MSNSLTTLIFTWEFPPNVVGGLSRHVSNLTVHLAELGVNVHVVTTGKGTLPEYETMAGVHVHRVVPLNENDGNFFSWIGGLNLAMALKAEEIAKQVQFDFIHAHDWLVGVAAITTKELLQIPLLTTIHATEYGRNNGIHNEIQQFVDEKERQLMSESDHIIVCSHFMRDELSSVFSVPKTKMSIIPNGIKVIEEPTSMDCPSWFTGGKHLVFSIGRIVKEKGFDTLINAAELVKKRNLDIYFVVAGKGPMLEQYRNEIDRRELGEQIVFIGYISDKERDTYILKSTVTVFPSYYEPFGIVALESMCLGKPTIVSNVGGLKGIVNHLETGLLMIPGNPENLLEQIHFLLTHQEKAKAIGLHGKSIVKGVYGWRRIATVTKSLIEDLLINIKYL